MAMAVEAMEKRQTVAHVERYIAAERRRAAQWAPGGVPSRAAIEPPIRANEPRAGDAGYEPQAVAPGGSAGRDWWAEVGAWAFALTLLVLVALALYWAAARAIDGVFW